MNAPGAFIPKHIRLSMLDFAHGLSYALKTGEGLLQVGLGVFGTIGLNILGLDLGALLTAIPAFIGALSAVAVGTWFSWKKKTEDIEERREQRALDTMRELQANGTIQPGMDADERLEILKKFRDNF